MDPTRLRGHIPLRVCSPPCPQARDATVTKLAELNATWDTESASRDELTVEIAGLSADIAQLTKAPA